MKKTIRLNENHLKQIVMESVKKVLTEGDVEDYEDSMLRSELSDYNNQIVGDKFEEHISNSLFIARQCLERLSHKYLSNRYVNEAYDGICETMYCLTTDNNGKDYDDPEYEEWENGGTFTLRAAKGLLKAKRCLEKVRDSLYKQGKSSYQSSTNLLINMAYEQILRAEKYINQERYKTALDNF